MSRLRLKKNPDALEKLGYKRVYESRAGFIRTYEKKDGVVTNVITFEVLPTNVDVDVSEITKAAIIGSISQVVGMSFEETVACSYVAQALIKEKGFQIELG